MYDVSDITLLIVELCVHCTTSRRRFRVSKMTSRWPINTVLTLLISQHAHVASLEVRHAMFALSPMYHIQVRYAMFDLSSFTMFVVSLLYTK
jgi:hypothetical protein